MDSTPSPQPSPTKGKIDTPGLALLLAGILFFWVLPIFDRDGYASAGFLMLGVLCWVALVIRIVTEKRHAVPMNAQQQTAAAHTARIFRVGMLWFVGAIFIITISTIIFLVTYHQ